MSRSFGWEASELPSSGDLDPFPPHHTAGRLYTLNYEEPLMSLRIFAESRFLNASTIALAKELERVAAPALMTLTHSDGELALFNDSWHGEVPPPVNLVGPAIKSLRESVGGYHRFTGKDLDVWFDAGPIGLPWNPGHGHSDFLGVEVDIAGIRFIVDPGTSTYSTGDRRQFERSAAAHNGPRWKGVEPIEYFGNFRVGALVQPTHVQHRENSVSATMRHARGKSCKRGIVLDGSELVISDQWTSLAGAMTSLLVPSDWRVESHSDRQLIFKHIPSGRNCCLSIRQGLKEVEFKSAQWSREFMQRLPATEITLLPDSDSNGGGKLSFSILPLYD